MARIIRFPSVLSVSSVVMNCLECIYLQLIVFLGRPLWAEPCVQSTPIGPGFLGRRRMRSKSRDLPYPPLPVRANGRKTGILRLKNHDFRLFRGYKRYPKMPDCARLSHAAKVGARFLKFSKSGHVPIVARHGSRTFQSTPKQYPNMQLNARLILANRADW